MKSFFTSTLLFLCAFVFAQNKIEQAEAKIASGDYKDAIGLLEEILEKNTENAEAYFLKGKAEMGLKEYEDAFYAFTEAIDIDDFNAEYYFERANLLMDVNQVDRGITDYTMALNYATDDSMRLDALTNRGSAKSKIREFESALEDFNNALKIDSLSWHVLNDIGMTYYGLEDFENSKIYIDKMIKHYPDRQFGYANMGFLLSEQEEYEESLKFFDKALKISDEDAFVFNNRGYSFLKLGKLDKALDDIDRSIDLNQKNSYAFRNRALVYLEMDKNRKVCKDLEKALELGYTREYGDDVSELYKEHCQ